MSNPFLNNEDASIPDEMLVERALKGGKEDLEELVRRHQGWIYNVALRMTCDPDDAEDVMQEALLIILTKLSTFRGDSRFRTWIYRLASVDDRFEDVDRVLIQQVVAGHDDVLPLFKRFGS